MKKSLLFALVLSVCLPSCGGMLENVKAKDVARTVSESALILCQTLGTDGEPVGVYVMVDKEDLELTGGSAADYCEKVAPIVRELVSAEQASAE